MSVPRHPLPAAASGDRRQLLPSRRAARHAATRV